MESAKKFLFYCGLSVLSLALPLLPQVAVAEVEAKPLRWYGYVYAGKLVTDNFTDIHENLTSLDFVDSKMIAVGGGKELYHYKDYFTLEGEGQVAQHLGEINDHTEFNALVNFRWQMFPWDRWLDTSFGWGLGGSIAADTPQFEKDNGDKSSPYLIAMMVDVDVIVPGQEDWSVFTRIHHRSSGFGLINSVDSTSDAITAGIKKRF